MITAAMRAKYGPKLLAMGKRILPKMALYAIEDAANDATKAQAQAPGHRHTKAQVLSAVSVETLADIRNGSKGVHGVPIDVSIRLATSYTANKIAPDPDGQHE